MPASKKNNRGKARQRRPFDPLDHNHTYDASSSSSGGSLSSSSSAAVVAAAVGGLGADRIVAGHVPWLRHDNMDFLTNKERIASDSKTPKISNCSVAAAAAAAAVAGKGGGGKAAAAAAGAHGGGGGGERKTKKQQHHMASSNGALQPIQQSAANNGAAAARDSMRRRGGSSSGGGGSRSSANSTGSASGAASVAAARERQRANRRGYWKRGLEVTTQQQQQQQQKRQKRDGQRQQPQQQQQKRQIEDGGAQRRTSSKEAVPRCRTGGGGSAAVPRGVEVGGHDYEDDGYGVGVGEGSNITTSRAEKIGRGGGGADELVDENINDDNNATSKAKDDAAPDTVVATANGTSKQERGAGAGRGGEPATAPSEEGGSPRRRIQVGTESQKKKEKAEDDMDISSPDEDCDGDDPSALFDDGDDEETGLSRGGGAIGSAAATATKLGPVVSGTQVAASVQPLAKQQDSKQGGTSVAVSSAVRPLSESTSVPRPIGAARKQSPPGDDRKRNNDDTRHEHRPQSREIDKQLQQHEQQQHQGTSGANFQRKGRDLAATATNSNRKGVRNKRSTVKLPPLPRSDPGKLRSGGKRPRETDASTIVPVASRNKPASSPSALDPNASGLAVRQQRGPDVHVTKRAKKSKRPNSKASPVHAAGNSPPSMLEQLDEPTQQLKAPISERELQRLTGGAGRFDNTEVMQKMLASETQHHRSDDDDDTDDMLVGTTLKLQRCNSLDGSELTLEEWGSTICDEATDDGKQQPKKKKSKNEINDGGRSRTGDPKNKSQTSGGSEPPKTTRAKPLDSSKLSNALPVRATAQATSRKPAAAFAGKGTTSAFGNSPAQLPVTTATREKSMATCANHLSLKDPVRPQETEANAKKKSLKIASVETLIPHPRALASIRNAQDASNAAGVAGEQASDKTPNRLREAGAKEKRKPSEKSSLDVDSQDVSADRSSSTKQARGVQKKTCEEKSSAAFPHHHQQYPVKDGDSTETKQTNDAISEVELGNDDSMQVPGLTVVAREGTKDASSKETKESVDTDGVTRSSPTRNYREESVDGDEEEEESTPSNRPFEEQGHDDAKVTGRMTTEDGGSVRDKDRSGGADELDLPEQLSPVDRSNVEERRYASNPSATDRSSFRVSSNLSPSLRSTATREESTPHGGGSRLSSVASSPELWTAEAAGLRNTVTTFRMPDGRCYRHPPMPPGWSLHVSRQHNKPYYEHPFFGVSFFPPVLLPSIGELGYPSRQSSETSTSSTSGESSSGSPREDSSSQKFETPQVSNHPDSEMESPTESGRTSGGEGAHSGHSKSLSDLVDPKAFPLSNTRDDESTKASTSSSVSENSAQQKSPGSDPGMIEGSPNGREKPLSPNMADLGSLSIGSRNAGMLQGDQEGGETEVRSDASTKAASTGSDENLETPGAEEVTVARLKCAQNGETRRMGNAVRTLANVNNEAAVPQSDSAASRKRQSLENWTTPDAPSRSEDGETKTKSDRGTGMDTPKLDGELGGTLGRGGQEGDTPFPETDDDGIEEGPELEEPGSCEETYQPNDDVEGGEETSHPGSVADCDEDERGDMQNSGSEGAGGLDEADDPSGGFFLNDDGDEYEDSPPGPSGDDITPAKARSHATYDDSASFKLSSRMSVIVHEQHGWDEEISLLGEASRADRGSVALHSRQSFSSQWSYMSHRVLSPPHPICALQNLEILPLWVSSSQKKRNVTKKKKRAHKKVTKSKPKPPPQQQQQKKKKKTTKRKSIIPRALRR